MVLPREHVSVMRQVEGLRKDHTSVTFGKNALNQLGEEPNAFLQIMTVVDGSMVTISPCGGGETTQHHVPQRNQRTPLGPD